MPQSASQLYRVEPRNRSLFDTEDCDRGVLEALEDRRWTLRTRFARLEPVFPSGFRRVSSIHPFHPISKTDAFEDKLRLVW